MVIIPNYSFIKNNKAVAQQNNDRDLEVQNTNNLIFAMAVGALTGTVGIISSVLTAYINKKGDIQYQIKNDLRNRRVDVYSELFKHMLPVSIFSNNLKNCLQLKASLETFIE